MLNKIKGFGGNQDKGKGSNSDPTLDTTKLGVGQTDTDHTIKTILKDLLKPHG
jgi:hypothetical protein